MTRENKIGLLVGLAFIIAVGILISNYLSVTNEPQQKSLQVAGSAVRSSLGDPAPTADPLSSPSTVRVPNAIAPSNPVPTAGELAARSRAASPAIEPVITKTTDQMLPYPAFVAAPSNPAAVPPGQNQSLLDAARRAGEALIAPSDDPSTTPPVAAPRHAAARTVVAESGDSLSDLAEKAYGSSTKATRNAIIAANPSLRANPNLIRAGQSYLVTTADSNTDDVPPTHATTPPPSRRRPSPCTPSGRATRSTRSPGTKSAR